MHEKPQHDTIIMQMYIGVVPQSLLLHDCSSIGVSPYEVEVGAGEHTLTVRPGRNEQCRRRIPLVLGPFQI